METFSSKAIRGYSIANTGQADKLKFIDYKNKSAKGHIESW